MAEKQKTLFVRAADPTIVGLFDRDPAHPPNSGHPDGGEVFIAGTEVVEVADVSAVRVAITEGRLVEVTGPQANAPEVKAKA